MWRKQGEEKGNEKGNNGSKRNGGLLSKQNNTAGCDGLDTWSE